MSTFELVCVGNNQVHVKRDTERRASDCTRCNDIRKQLMKNAPLFHEQ